jgi:hypothetical protein
MEVSMVRENISRGIKPSFEDGAEGSKRTTSDWWAPVWKGLFLDGDGKHYKRIKSAIWLLLYFFLCANRKTGSLKRKLSTISQETGIKTRTIRTWLDILRKGGYVTTGNSGRCLTIVINKWKTLPDGHSDGRQSGGFMKGRVAKECHSDAALKGRETNNLSHNPAVNHDCNDKTINKYKLQNDNVADDCLSIAHHKNQDLLAYEICNAFKDEKNSLLYLCYVRKYPMEIIKRAFDEAVRMPPHKIKKTRGALFNYLVRRYAKE